MDEIQYNTIILAQQTSAVYVKPDSRAQQTVSWLLLQAVRTS